MSIDVTKEVLALRALEESEAKLRSVISASPVAMSLFVGPDYVVEMPNQAFIDVVGKGPGIIGMPLRYAMPELESQPFLQILNDVYTKGEMYRSSGDQVSIVRDGIMTKNYYNITYTPLRDSEGNVNAILGTGADVTEGVVTQKKIEESQMQLLALFEQSTVAIAIIAAENLTFTMANPRYGKLVRRDPASIVGKSLLDALPELAGQGFDELLNEVIKTGIPFLATEQPVDIIEDGQLTKIYVDFTYQPKKELDGSITGVLVLATDVTPQVQSREKIREAESTLRGAVELADLGTWQINLSTGILDYSQRLREWFGILNDETITIERAYSAIRELDRPAVKAAITHAITLGTNQIFDVEYQVNKELTGKQRILHAQGRAYFNEKGEAVKINGTVQDVTEQRKIQLALEQQVKERTEEIEITNQELAASNEELASINEEYLAINEELAKSNDLLARSNENLQQFAYVASHDLQEPLRKVQSFGDLLKQRYSSELGEGVAYVQRMQAASGRMSVLIEDLLTFSRISTKQDSTEEISLMKVVNTVLSDLEVSIHESNAHITVEALPVVTGDESQFGQLFQNLISNALKFRKSGVNPEIEINYTVTKSENLPARAKPTRYTPAYHCIKVIDNGIGFDDRNSDRIFQVFQRLHGKNQYAGTGIGLAICEKVMANHGGAIVANSQIGLGSTFSIFLPF
jgi:PAS domain S-box-containing protein